MQEFIDHFKRDADGGWTCISETEFRAPNGRLQVAVGSRFTRGTHFMGVDVAEWLDEQLDNDRRKDSRRSHYLDQTLPSAAS